MKQNILSALEKLHRQIRMESDAALNLTPITPALPESRMVLNGRHWKHRGARNPDAVVDLEKQPRPGEITYKQWVRDRAVDDDVSEDAIYYRRAAGKYPDLKVRRVNGRVMFVLDGTGTQMLPMHNGRPSRSGLSYKLLGNRIYKRRLRQQKRQLQITAAHG